MDEFLLSSHIRPFNDETNPCSNSPYNNNTIILVKTAPHHFYNRYIIRNTWVRETVNESIETRFVIGETGNSTIDALLQKESRRYGDIVRAGFHDHYYNLTLKSVFMLSYASHYCPNSWTLFTDDDMIINAKGLTAFIRRQDPKQLSLHCWVWKNVKVRRDPDDKFYVPEEMLSGNISHYPDYCSGTGYLLPPNASSLLFATALITEPKLKFEDAFVTGFTRVKAGIGMHSDRKKFGVYVYWFWVTCFRDVIVTIGQTDDLVGTWIRFVRIRDHPHIHEIMIQYPVICVLSIVCVCIFLFRRRVRLTSYRLVKYSPLDLIKA